MNLVEEDLVEGNFLVCTKVDEGLTSYVVGNHYMVVSASKELDSLKEKEVILSDEQGLYHAWSVESLLRQVTEDEDYTNWQVQFELA